MEVSHIVVKKGGIFWERGVNSGRVAYRCLKGGGGTFWEGGREGRVDSESVTLYKRGYILGGRGIFWEGGVVSGIVAYSCEKFEVGLYCGREEYILGGSHICLKGGYILG